MLSASVDRWLQAGHDWLYACFTCRVSISKRPVFLAQLMMLFRDKIKSERT